MERSNTMADIFIEKTTSCPGGYEIPQGATLRAPAGKTVVMTVNGAVTPIAPGRQEGNVVLTVIDETPVIGKTVMPPQHGGGEPAPVAYEHPYRAGVYVDVDEAGQTHVIQAKSVPAAWNGAKVTDAGIQGGSMVNYEEYFNQIFIADGTYRISDLDLTYDANGGDDFQLYGAAVAVGGFADVTLDRVNIQTRGSIATTVAAAEKSKVLVMNSTLKAEGIDERKYRDHCMTEVPWVLGLKGTVRASNVLQDADVTFYNVKASCNGWGVFSTDAVHDCRHLFVNTSATLKASDYYGSGYGNYVLGGSESTFLGVDYDIATYGIIATGAGQQIYVGPSSQKNLVEKLGPDTNLAKETGGYAQIPEKNSVFRCGRSFLMWHGSEGSDDPVVIDAGTVLETGGPTFLIKAQGRANPDGTTLPGAHPTIEVTGADIKNGGILLHYMESDDAGMGPAGFDGHWAPFYEVPVIEPKKLPGHDVTDPAAPGTMHLNLHQMQVSGDVYNSVYTTAQNLSLYLDRTDYAGAVTTGIQYHKNVKPGEKIYPDQAQEVGNVGITPAGDFCNGIIVTLENGSTWTVTGQSHVTGIVIGEGCQVKAPVGKTLAVTVDGRPAELKPGRYAGDIAITLA